MVYKIIKNRKLVQDEKFAGYNKENRAEKLEFEIPDELSEYTATINFETDDGNVYDLLDNGIYTLKNNITKYDKVRFYLEFTKEISENNLEVIKTEVKTLEFGESFDVDKEITQEEINIIQTIITQAGYAITRANAISEDLENKVATDYYRGATGENGADAKINGVNTLTIEAGTNITLDQEGNILTINSTGGGGGGTSNYNALTNKPKINNVELNGNKTSSDLGIQPAGDYALESDIPDVSNFITNSVNNLLNYYLKSETYTKQEVNNLIGQIATLQFQVVSTLPQTGDSKYIYLVPSSNPKTQNVKDEYIWVNNSWEQIGSTQIDLTGYATENWVNTQISGFLTQTQIQALINTALSEYTETDPTVPSHVKNITQANITSWNNKLDSSKVKNANSTTAGDVYDVRYINTMIGDVETILTRLTTGGGVS